MRTKRCWVIIADGMRARFFKTHGSGERWEEINAIESPAMHHRTQDLVSDKPGRAFDSKGKGRHAMVPPSDPRREQKRDFVRLVADQLAGDQSEFDQLVVVAAPAALGDLRDALAPAVLAKVTTQIDIDLTALPVDELQRRLSDRISAD